MEDIANVTSQQQVRPQGSAANQAKVASQTNQTKTIDIVKQVEQLAQEKEKQINSPEDVQSLVESLNKAIAPISTSLAFGVDKNDIFYVSVTDVTSDKVIRRFPAEQAADFLPKMQEITGILFDLKG